MYRPHAQYRTVKGAVVKTDLRYGGDQITLRPQSLNLFWTPRFLTFDREKLGG